VQGEPRVATGLSFLVQSGFGHCRGDSAPTRIRARLAQLSGTNRFLGDQGLHALARRHRARLHQERRRTVGNDDACNVRELGPEQALLVAVILKTPRLGDLVNEIWYHLASEMPGGHASTTPHRNRSRVVALIALPSHAPISLRSRGDLGKSRVSPGEGRLDPLLLADAVELGTLRPPAELDVEIGLERGQQSLT